MNIGPPYFILLPSKAAVIEEAYRILKKKELPLLQTAVTRVTLFKWVFSPLHSL